MTVRAGRWKQLMRGQGHISRAVGSKDRLSLYLHLPDDVSIPRR